MDKRYQVFVSSTYLDLSDERNEVMQALLELECMPAGMELFPAANETQWNWIKRIISESDYYIVLIGGCYGSIHPETGLSYTEMEFRYAVESNIPVIAFLHSDPEQLAAKKNDSDPKVKKKLNDFRNLVKKRLCKFYNSPEDLGAKVSRSLVQLKKQYPAIGWIRSNSVISNSDEMLKILRENDELKKRIESFEKSFVDDSLLANGEDLVDIEVKYSVRQTDSNSGKKVSDNIISIPLSIDKIFSIIGPSLLRNVSFYWSDPISDYIKEYKKETILEKHKGYKVQDIKVSKQCLDQLFIHFRAMNFLRLEEDNWKLTKNGDTYLTKLMSLHK